MRTIAALEEKLAGLRSRELGRVEQAAGRRDQRHQARYWREPKQGDDTDCKTRPNCGGKLDALARRIDSLQGESR